MGEIREPLRELMCGLPQALEVMGERNVLLSRLLEGDSEGLYELLRLLPCFAPLVEATSAPRQPLDGRL